MMKTSESQLAASRKWKQANKEKVAAYTRKWKQTNSEKSNAHTRKHRLSEGYCVYEAIFPEGKYIGSGQTVQRRGDHLKGRSTIARKLGSKATEFNVLISSSKEDCLEFEGLLIETIGLENLLNVCKVHISS